MSEPIHFYYDFISPYSYFAFTQRDEIRDRTGRELHLKPVYVGDIMKQVGNVPTSITCPAKRAYLGQDVARWAQKLRVSVQSHTKFGTFSTVPLIKAAMRAGDDVEAFSIAAFAAVWVDQGPLDDETAMTPWLAAKDERFATYWDERETMTDALAERVSEAVGDGAFGVPHFHTDKGDFFGNDRIEFLVEALGA
jgi:2-hydroxychromene-2-carboxylate isomerase